MKKILFLFPLLLSIIVSAQTSKGSFMVGGNASLSFDKSDYDGTGNSKSTSIGFNPDIGYFLANNFSAGISVQHGRSWSKSKVPSFTAEFHTDNNSLGVAPFVRYYIPVKKFFIVTQGSYGWYYTKTTYDSVDPVTGAIAGEEEFSNKYRGYSLAAGPAFFLSPYTSIEVLANYSDTTYDSFDQSTFYLSVGFQIYIPKIRE